MFFTTLNAGSKIYAQCVCIWKIKTKLNPDDARPGTGFIFMHFNLDTAQVTAVCPQSLNVDVKRESVVSQCCFLSLVCEQI